nr:hypothetical protein Itr_chr15CG01480 [Ipomoea trifida]
MEPNRIIQPRIAKRRIGAAVAGSVARRLSSFLRRLLRRIALRQSWYSFSATLSLSRSASRSADGVGGGRDFDLRREVRRLLYAVGWGGAVKGRSGG